MVERGARPVRKRLLLLLLLIPLTVAVSFVSTFGWAWYTYVTAGEPYEEIGIDVNSSMPGPLRRWGCAQIMRRYPGILPPYGCERP